MGPWVCPVWGQWTVPQGSDHLKMVEFSASLGPSANGAWITRAPAVACEDAGWREGFFVEECRDGGIGSEREARSLCVDE